MSEIKTFTAGKDARINGIHSNNTTARMIDTNEIIEEGNLINITEWVWKDYFWRNYREAKKWNPNHSKRDLLRAALMATAEYPIGFAIEDFKINFEYAEDKIEITYTVKVQYSEEQRRAER